MSVLFLKKVQVVNLISWSQACVYGPEQLKVFKFIVRDFRTRPNPLHSSVLSVQKKKNSFRKVELDQQTRIAESKVQVKN